MLYKKPPSELTSGYYNYIKFLDSNNKKIIDYLKKDGFKIYIIDLSLNFKFPAVGVFLFGNAFKFSFGLGMGISVNSAVRDGLIQILRGKNNKVDILNTMRTFMELDYEKYRYGNNIAYAHEYFLQRSYSHGVVPTEILEYALNNEVQMDDKIFQSMWNNLQQTCKDLGWNIFVRYPKFIGFSTCHVFIPNISEIGFTEDKNLINYNLLRCELLKFANNQVNAIVLLDLLTQSFSIDDLFSNLFDICYPEFSIKKGMDNTIKLVDMLSFLLRYIYVKQGSNKLKNINFNKFTNLSMFREMFISKQNKCSNILSMEEKELQDVVHILKKYPFKKNCKQCFIKDLCKIKM